MVEHISTMESKKEQALTSNVPVYDARTEKKLLRKVDYRLVPILAALYSISVVDRVNVSTFEDLQPFRRYKLTYKDRQRSCRGHGCRP